MIRQSTWAFPGGHLAARTRCTRRSVLVKVPFFSAKLAAGSTTSARLAVSVRKMSWTTRKSSLSKALPDVADVRVGDDAGSRP